MKISGTRESDSSATHSIIINAVQIAAIAAFTLYIVFLGPREHKVLTTVLIIAAILTISGAMLDIGEALRTRKRLRTISQLQDTNTQMDDLNLRLRAQRHDFLNHMQVVYNLIDNAIKFSNPDTVITVGTAVRMKKVYVSVKDRGVGIPRDSLKKIWDRFYKTDISRGRDKKGTGLGLSIVKEIIAAHGENIDVVSTEKVGTEFTFTLPLYGDDE